MSENLITPQEEALLKPHGSRALADYNQYKLDLKNAGVNTKEDLTKAGAFARFYSSMSYHAPLHFSYWGLALYLPVVLILVSSTFFSDMSLVLKIALTWCVLYSWYFFTIDHPKKAHKVKKAYRVRESVTLPDFLQEFYLSDMKTMTRTMEFIRYLHELDLEERYQKT